MKILSKLKDKINNLKEDFEIIADVNERKRNDSGHRYTHEEVKAMLSNKIKKAKESK